MSFLGIYYFLNWFVSGVKNIGLTRITLTYDSCDNPIAGADNVTTFFSINPTVQMHDVATIMTFKLTITSRATIITYYVTLTLKWAITSVKYLTSVIWMVTILEPLMRFNHYRLFSEFSHEL